MPSPEIRTLLVLEPSDLESFGDLVRRHDRLVRDSLTGFEAREIEKSEHFLLLFERPFDAVRCALGYLDELSRLASEHHAPVSARVGIHLGELFLRENPAEHVARGARPLEVEGPARARAARLASLARDGQVLLTDTAYELAHRAWVGQETLPGLRWLDHGLYRFSPGDETLRVFEAGIEGRSPLAPPDRFEKVWRAVAVRDAPAWRPDVGRPVPQRPNWLLERRLNRPGQAAWLAVHKKTRDERVFRFCTEPGDRAPLERQVRLFRGLREALAERRDVVRLIDWNLDEDPCFLESEHVEGTPLPDWAREQGGLKEVPLGQRLELVVRVAEVVAALHAAGEVLGELDPSSFLVVDESSREICLAELPSGRPAAGRRRRTDRAPELADGAVATARSDVHALGVFLYQMAVGDLHRTPGPFWERDATDPDLYDAVASCIEPVAAHRVSDAGEVVRALRALQGRGPGRRARRRKLQTPESFWRWVSVILLLTVILLVLLRLGIA